MAKKKEPAQKMQIMPEGVLAPYGIRKTYNHVVNVKKKRTNSLVRMKPLKDRGQVYDVPEFCPKGYSQTEFDHFKEEFERIRQHTKQDLKEILKLNKQDTSINSRAEILNRCADGYALGRVPKCPACFGTNPVYNKYTGEYLCPGYKEGDNFIKCDTSYTREELPRVMDWNNDFERRQAIRLVRTEKKLKHEREYQIQYKRAKKKRLAREQRKRQGLPTESEGSDEEKSEQPEKTEKAQAQIKRQTSSVPDQSDSAVEDLDESQSDDEPEDEKIESERSNYRMQSEREDSKRIDSERQ